MKFLVFGGGGKVARHFTRIASKQSHGVICVVRNNDHVDDLKSIGGTPAILSIEDATVPDLTGLLTEHKPDVVIFAAGAGGKGGADRTMKVDYEGAVKVFNAMETANIRRLLLVGAKDVRDRSKGYPDYYNEESKKSSDGTWNAIGKYMQAKLQAEQELHSRKQLDWTVLRPGHLTLDPAKGCQMGITQTGSASRELVAQALLGLATGPSTAGLTIDLMDGDKTVEEEVERIAKNKVDAWEG